MRAPNRARPRFTAEVVDLGRAPYRETLAYMRELHARVARDEAPETWIVVEHDPVITLGRNAKREHVHLTDAALAARGVEIVAVERGGDATYHGPGQLVVYPIRKLERFREVAPLVSALERAVVTTLVAFGIEATPRSEHRGVYVGTKAICAIGLSIKQMTSLHGLALNVSTALDYDRLITPCGTPEFGITSIENELGRNVSFDEVKPLLLNALADALPSRLVRLSRDIASFEQYEAEISNDDFDQEKVRELEAMRRSILKAIKNEDYKL